jgi:hypothetical protein
MWSLSGSAFPVTLDAVPADIELHPISCAYNDTDDREKPIHPVAHALIQANYGVAARLLDFGPSSTLSPQWAFGRY